MKKFAAVLPCILLMFVSLADAQKLLTGKEIYNRRTFYDTANDGRRMTIFPNAWAPTSSGGSRCLRDSIKSISQQGGPSAVHTAGR
jgi:hypothetical protein